MVRFGYHIPILAYHRVGEPRMDHVPTVSALTFERQLALLSRWKYLVITLDEVAAYLEKNKHFPKRSVAITFDDGYEETYSVAWPLLKRFGLNATVFVTPGEVGLAGFASWEQLRSMAQDGLAIGSHTMNHSYLPIVEEKNRLAEELVGSKRAIEEKVGNVVNFLSYPVGGFTPLVQKIAKQAGYLAACTTNRVAPKGALGCFSLRRIKVTERDRHPILFWAKVCGYYDCFRQLRDPS